MPRQACSKTTEKQEIKEIKLGALKNAFCRTSLKLKVNISTYPPPSSVSRFTFHCVPLVAVPSTTKEANCPMGAASPSTQLSEFRAEREKMPVSGWDDLKGQECNGLRHLSQWAHLGNLPSELYPVIF